MKLGKNSWRFITIVTNVLILAACTTPAYNPAAEQTVRRFVTAFNQHNVTAMLVETTPTIAWLSVAEESISAQTQGQPQLQQAMVKYFAAVPSVQSTLVSMTVSGNFVNTIEKATWLNRGQTQQLCSRAVYELDNNKINKVWYFPAEDC